MHFMEILSFSIAAAMMTSAFSLLAFVWWSDRRIRRNPNQDSEVGVVGYKIFESNWKCHGLQYKVGEKISRDHAPVFCSVGFHFCLNANNCTTYYTTEVADNRKFALVEAVGAVEYDGYKCVTNSLKILKELSRNEFLKLCKTKQVDQVGERWEKSEHLFGHTWHWYPEQNDNKLKQL